MAKNKKRKLPIGMNESREAHRERIANDGRKYQHRVETPKTVYNRKREKSNALKGW